MPALKPRYEAFCEHYAQHPNASLAAELAGYSGLNCDKQGWRLLRRPEIVARIAELRTEQAAIDSLNLPALLAKLTNAYHIANADSAPMAVARLVELEAKLALMFAKLRMHRPEDAPAAADALREEIEHEHARRAGMEAATRSRARSRAASSAD
jgi:phage terminase small subunit